MTTHTRGACDTIAHPAMKKSPHQISTCRSRAVSQRFGKNEATKRWRERECKREERIGARERGKARDPDPQNGQRGVENERNEKIPVEQKAGDPLGERTIASPPQRRRFEQQLAASHGRCIAHERATWLSERRSLIGLASAARRAWHRIS